MKCDCGKPAVIEQKYSGKALCSGCFLKSTDNRIRRTLKDNNMLARGDKVVVGHSAGKDSTLALHYLHRLSQKFPIEVVAVTVDEGIKWYRKPSIKVSEKFCKERGIEHHTVSFRELFGFELDDVAGRGPKTPCAYCGVFRRRALNIAALDLKADKVAIAHNLDDEAQVILMNYLRGDIERSARLGPVSKPVRKGFVPRIKPLRAIPERETLAYCLLQGLEIDNAECPYAPLAFRNEIRDLLNNFEEKYPGTKYAIVKGFDRLLPTLQKVYSKRELNACKECGEPCSGRVCKACDYLSTFFQAKKAKRTCTKKAVTFKRPQAKE